MEKDYRQAVRGGFEATGLFPFNPNKPLAKMPAEEREITTQVHQALLNQLQEMRYSPAVTKRAQHPRKKDKLPAGAAYTCAAGGDARDSEPESDSDSDSSDSETERQENVNKIIRRLAKKGPLDPESEEEEESEEEISEEEQEMEKEKEMEEEMGEKEMGEKEMQQKPEESLEEDADFQRFRFFAGSYVAVVYEGDWYVGQVKDKEEESEADRNDIYIYVDFLQRTPQNFFYWPKKADLLNVLKEDVLFAVRSPTLVNASSSGRTTNLQLTKDDLAKAKRLFTLYKAFYPTENSLHWNWYQFLVGFLVRFV